MNRTTVLALTLASSALAGSLRIGRASVDITPPPDVPLAGYYHVRYSTGTHDPLRAKAIVIEKDGVRAALVSLDLIGLPREFVERARVQIEGLTFVPGDNAMIGATHSHTGPEMGGRLKGVEPKAEAAVRRWHERLPGLIADSVKAAEADLQPAQLSAVVASEDGVSFIRRFQMIDGTVGWNPGKLNPKIVAPVGTIDAAIPILSFDTPGDAARRRPLAAYVNFANHLDTVGGTDYSADYPFTISGVLDAARGPNHVSLFSLGCAGNINHIDVKRAEPQKGHGEAARIGAILGADVLKALPGAKPLDPATLRVQRQMVALPLAPFDPAEAAWARETLANYGTPGARPFNDQVKAFRVLDIEARQGAPIEAEVQVVTLGVDVAFVGLPGEMFADLGKLIKQKSPFAFTIVSSLTNGAIGYVPDRKAYPEGAYEVISTRVAEGGGERMVEAALRMLANARQ